MARNAKLNKFNLSHAHNTSIEPGYLYPVDFVECLPGDIFKIQNEFLMRFMPTVAPLINRFRVAFRWWYSPTRLLMDDWPKFISGGADGQDSTVFPYVSAPSGGFAVGSLADHFRIPTGVGNIAVSAMPFRMYNLVWNEWYRAESIQTKSALSLASGADTTTNTSLLKANWRRDYFTDALPSPQKGPAIGLFGQNSLAPVVGNGKTLGLTDGTNEYGTLLANTTENYRMATTDYAGASLDSSTHAVGASGTWPAIASGQGTIMGLSKDSTKSGVVADLSAVNDATINAFRQAAAIQQFQELNMRGGSDRYVEFVWNHYGVRTPDASLQRPIYVGGMTSNVVISEVLQTSETTSASPQGSMAGHGIGAGVSPVLKFRSLEHGYLMCLMSVQPDTIYYQGIPRELSRETRFDFAIPLLSHLGEQAVYNKELFAQGSTVVDSDGNIVDNKPFGYNPRYEEYRKIPSAITGQLRSTLNFWTGARTFTNLPTLNSSFIESNPATNIWAVQNGTDHIILQVMHHMHALRPLPKYGQPGLHII